MLTYEEWMQVEGFLSGTIDGAVPHLSFNAWHIVYYLWEACLLPEDVIAVLKGA